MGSHQFAERRPTGWKLEVGSWRLELAFASRTNFPQYRVEIGGLQQTPDAELAGHVAGIEIRADADDRHVCESRILQLTFAELPSVHARHLQVEEHQAGAARA